MTGIRLDPTLQQRYVAFKDPDRIAWELYMTPLAGMFPVIEGVRLLHHVAEGDSVAARFDLDTPFGVIEVLDLFRVTAGRIAEIHPFYDPTPITSAQTASPSS